MPRTAWVTGASSGIGRAVSLALAGRGWQVAATARGEHSLGRLAAAPESAGRIRAYAADVTDRGMMRSQVQRIEAELGDIDLAIFSAGTHEPMPADRFASDILRRLLEINVMGVAHGMESVLPGMLARARGRIMIVASVAGYAGLPTAAAYGATKAALINMAEALRPELAARGVILQLVNPGFVRTPLTDRNDFPMPYLISAEEAAGEMMRGLDGTRFEIAFPKRMVWLMKLARLVPYWLYFRLTGRLMRK